jgi:hypothetical protein
MPSLAEHALLGRYLAQGMIAPAVRAQQEIGINFVVETQDAMIVLRHGCRCAHWLGGSYRSTSDALAV